MSLQDMGFSAERMVRGPLRVVSARTRPVMQSLRQTFGPHIATARDHLAPVADWIATSWLSRQMAKSLRRRIVISNMIGLAVLMIGWSWLSQHNIWLIDAKRDALRTQSEIIAAAVASSAAINPTTGNTQRDVFDPDLATERIARGVVESETLDDFDFAIRPEVVAPILAKLIAGTETRSRIFGHDGTPIVDSNDFLRPDGLLDPTRPESTNQVTKPKNFWTRFLKWRLNDNLPVYQDIDGVNGRSYPEIRKALRNGRNYSVVLMTEAGEQVVAMITPVQRRDKIHGVLMLSTTPGEIDNILGEERLRILLLALLATIATVVASGMLAHTVAQPVRNLSEAADEVSRDINASDRLPVFEGREDEVGQLARSFATMTVSLRQRIENSERFAADVAHELKNPVTGVKSLAESLTYAKTDEQRADMVEQIKRELDRLSRLITDVSEAQRTNAELALQETRPINLPDVIESVVSVFGDILKYDERGIKLLFDNAVSEGDAVVRGHDGRLGQVLTNLIDNAISFSPQDATVSVRLRTAARGLLVTVEDEGPGVDPEQIEKIFKRFYTYRPTAESSRGNNSGLGLSITREIIEAHNGRIWVENRPAGGARFCIELPRAPVAVARRRSTLGFRRS